MTPNLHITASYVAVFFLPNGLEEEGQRGPYYGGEEAHHGIR